MMAIAYIVTLAFIGLKLTGFIAYGWLYVFLPIWVLWGLQFVVLFGREFNRAFKRHARIAESPPPQVGRHAQKAH